MLAVLNGHTECVFSLLSQGASVENQDRWGRTALHRGVRSSINMQTLHTTQCVCDLGCNDIRISQQDVYCNIYIKKRQVHL